MALRLHVDAPEPVHPERVLDAVDILGGREQPDHVRAAEDERLTVPPALHRAILCPLRRARSAARPPGTERGDGVPARAGGGHGGAGPGPVPAAPRWWSRERAPPAPLRRRRRPRADRWRRGTRPLDRAFRVPEGACTRLSRGGHSSSTPGHPRVGAGPVSATAILLRACNGSASTSTWSARTRTWSRASSRRPRTPGDSRSSGCRSSCARPRSACSRSGATISAPTGRSTCTAAPLPPASRSTCRATSRARRYRRRPASGRATRTAPAFKHALYEAFFCEGLDIATDGEIARAAGIAGLDPVAAVTARTTTSASSNSARSGAAPRRASPASRRSSPRTAGRTGAWAAWTGCSRTSRSFRERPAGQHRCRVAPMVRESTASGAPPGSSARSRRSPARTSTSSEAIRRYAARRTAAARSITSRRRSGARLHGHRGSGRHARRPQPTSGRACVRHRLALRLEPQRRPLRRDDGCRHRARGAGSTPSTASACAAARLVPRGGGLRVRPDAARQPDHAPASPRRTCANASARSDDGRSFWEHAEAAGYEPERWRESIHVLDDLTGGSRCTSSRPGFCRTLASESGS